MIDISDKKFQKISIIIPVYNLEDYISKCLKSVINQSYKNIEIIIVNDGSTDKSSEICESYSKIDSRIKVIHQYNQGPSIARNNGIDAATGAYISFIDGDDWIEPDMIETLYENSHRYDADISACNINYINGNGSIIVDENGKGPFHNIYDFTDNNVVILEGYEKIIKYISTNVNVFWNKLYKKYLFDNMRLPYNNKIHQDVFPTWQLIDKANKIVMLSMCKYNYLSRDGSLSNTSFFKPNAISLIEAYIERYNDIVNKYPEYPKLEKISRKYIFNNLLYVIDKACTNESINLYRKDINNIINAVKLYDIYDCGLDYSQEQLLKILFEDIDKYILIMKTLRKRIQNKRFS